MGGILDTMAVMASNLPRSRWMEMMWVMWVCYSEKLLWNKKGGALKFKKNLQKSSIQRMNSSKICVFVICVFVICVFVTDGTGGAAYTMKSQIFQTQMHKFCVLVH